MGPAMSSKPVSGHMSGEIAIDCLEEKRVTIHGAGHLMGAFVFMIMAVIFNLIIFCLSLLANLETEN